ncbi:MAG: hypothetical protein KatS3mg002_0389 [Candidatus Woesearchaeota archaeon]|nr:MAG: hypothetical protein KatS3mg002_0389 [Candidatus Woesearchaeota archaeon]
MWFNSEWVKARCYRCGNKIWPEGDPDWVLCYSCFSEKIQEETEQNILRCDICEVHEAVTNVKRVFVQQ